MKDKLEPNTLISSTKAQFEEIVPQMDSPLRCVPGLIAQRAAATPGALAVSHGPETLTYAELESRANQMAHFL